MGGNTKGKECQVKLSFSISCGVRKCLSCLSSLSKLTIKQLANFKILSSLAPKWEDDDCKLQLERKFIKHRVDQAIKSPLVLLHVWIGSG